MIDRWKRKRKIQEVEEWRLQNEMQISTVGTYGEKKTKLYSKRV